MHSQVFGSKSPCCAAYTLRKEQSDNETNADVDAVETIRSNIYVDDLCKSCPTQQETVKLVTQLRQLLASGGFRLTKFLSHMKNVLLNVPHEDLAGGVKVGSWRLPISKTLGVMWDPTTDELKVRVDVDERPCTRRGLLFMIAQTYDPLGIIQPFLLPARQLLQQACSAQLGWDKTIDVLPGLELRWPKWFKFLLDLQQVSVPRCFLLRGKEVREVQLHAFFDSHSYGACLYIFRVYTDASLQCSLVMGKSRVAPLKRVSVPRLKLEAAVLSASCAV